MRVAVVGAGIAGLGAAIAFRRHGADVVVHERPGAITAGAGISLFGNGLRALDWLGVGHVVRAIGAPPDVPTGLRTPDGEWLIRSAPAGAPEFVVVHRADLHDILTAAAPRVRPHTVAQVRESGDTATVVLDSGDTATYDLVIGADGIGSGIRRSWPDDPGIRYAGYTAWRGVTSGPFDTRTAGETYGRGERFGIVPMKDGRVYWYATASVPASWPVPDEKAELIRRFGRWHDPIPALLHDAAAGAVLRNDILELVAPLPRLVSGRIVLVGDAAHAMTPDLGQGGNLALEDVVTLAALVTRERQVRPALDRYDTTRRRRTAAIARTSRQMGRIGQLHGRVAVAVRNTLLGAVPAGVTVRATARLQDWEPPPTATGR